MNKKKKVGFSKRLKNYFLTGLLVLVPAVLTGYVIWFLFINVDGLLRGVVSDFILSRLSIDLGIKSIPGVGLLAVVLIILITGLVARNVLGRYLISFGEYIVKKIPIISSIYNTFQQISRAFLSEKREAFKKPVLVEYPRKGIYSIGFITQYTKGQVAVAVDDKIVSIFMPTTPNPTSGYLLFIPEKDLIPLNLSVEEAMKLVISAGSIVPEPLISEIESQPAVPFVKQNS